MTTLQGVIILRNSDLKRFFEYDEFMNKKNEFVGIFKTEIRRKVHDWKPYFVDTDEEVALLANLCTWLEHPSLELVGVELSNDCLTIKRLNEKACSFPLGRLGTHITKAKEEMTSKDVTGITLLYLLLGANAADSDINIVYKKTERQKFAPCYDNQILNPADTFAMPATYRVFANMHPLDPIQLQCGPESRQLHPGECMVGVFCGEKCYKLLNNIVNDIGNRTTLKLVANGSAPRLEIRIPQGGDISRIIPNARDLNLQHGSTDNCFYIDNVISLIYKQNCGLAYTDTSGNVVFPSSDRWYMLNRNIESFLAQYPDDKIIALINEDHLISDRHVN